MNIARVERKLIVRSEDVGVSAYDFDFELHFACDHPYRIDGEELCVLRVGAIRDYATEYDDKLSMGLRLVNSPALAEACHPRIHSAAPGRRPRARESAAFD